MTSTAADHVFPETGGVCAPISEYSNVVVSNDARQLAFISGQVALGADGAMVADTSIEGQTRQVFENLGRCLDAVGMSWRNVVKWTTYLTEAADVSGFYAARRELFEDLYPSGNYPGNSLLIVKALVRPEFLVEIEAVAAA